MKNVVQVNVPATALFQGIFCVILLIIYGYYLSCFITAHGCLILNAALQLGAATTSVYK